MLLSLHIENVAVIKRVDIDFTCGFTALTGETGAGKSIIIDSIGLLLGKKAEREMIRHGESSLMVSGLFGELDGQTLATLSDVGINADEDGTVLVQRTVSQDGRSQVKLNGRTVSISIIREIMPSLISIHGQSDTHSLTDPKKHLEILDRYSGAEELLAEYRDAYERLERIKAEIRDVKAKVSERARMAEILEYQIKDIDSADLHEGEEEELIDKKLKIKNSERINKNATFVFKALKGSEKGSVSFLLDRSISALTQISDVIPECADYAERLRDFLYQAEDIAEDVYAVLDGEESDPDEALNKIEAKLDKISKLKRKYGLTVADILAFRARAAEELSVMENADSVLEKLEKDRKEAYCVALALADKLHELRKSSASKLEGSVKETLEFLDMPKVVFFASIKEEYKNGEKELYENGCDRVEFFISANRGADSQPLAKIASGGELARIMLALKTAVADKDSVSTIIFDEIDAGVSGKTARKIGIKMLTLSQNAQIFTVTHSAQIASLSDTHLLISKGEVADAVETSVRALNYDERVCELSRILGGIQVTEAQKNAAVDMLKEKSEYQ